MSVPKAFLEVRFQSCNWHAVQAMLVRFRKNERYSKEDIDGTEAKDGIRLPRLKDLAWQYIKLIIIEEFKQNRESLLVKLCLGDCQYIENIWILKER